MSSEPLILLYEPDEAVAAALRFALALDGFRVVIGDPEANDLFPAACLVIDQRQPVSDGVGLLLHLRRRGHAGPAIILATHPGRALREQVRAAGAALVEKPLLDEALVRALHRALQIPRAA